MNNIWISMNIIHHIIKIKKKVRNFLNTWRNTVDNSAAIHD